MKRACEPSSAINKAERNLSYCTLATAASVEYVLYAKSRCAGRLVKFRQALMICEADAGCQACLPYPRFFAH